MHLLKALKILLMPLTPVYWVIIYFRNLFFDLGLFESKDVGVKVISVGNLTVGGSGKTPTVIYLTKLLKSFGFNTGVLSRGYLRSSSGYLLVSDGKEFKTSIKKCGDEIYLTSQECEAPAAVCEKRVEGALKFQNDIKLDAIILDDAYQHRWIKRDLNLLIFDQRFLMRTGMMDQTLLPFGLLREPFSAVKRADAILVNRKFSDNRPIPNEFRKIFRSKPVFNAFYKSTGIVDIKTNKIYPLEEFHGQKSLVVCGIARPYSFLKKLETNNINITNKLLFTDHKNYTSKEVQLIRKKFYDTNSFSVLTTQKDAVKFSNFSKELDDIDIYYLKIELEIEKRDEFEKIIMNIIN